MIYKLKCRDINKVLGFLSEEQDCFDEWYITINNQRVFLKDPKVLNKYVRKIKKGEVILGNYNSTGFIYTWGMSEIPCRVYIKLMASEEGLACQMIQNFLDKYGNYNLYTKIKKDNPIKSVFTYYGFRFKGGRGKEILLAREAVKYD